MAGVEFDIKKDTKRKGIEPTQVKSIKLLTPLEKGSDNDGTGKNFNQDGAVFGKTYKFIVDTYTHLPPKDKKKIKWKFKYHSLSKNKWVEYTSPKTGEEYSLYLNEKDICGRTLHIMAYINDEESEGYLKVWHHNRFRFFDRKLVEKQAEERAKDPWKVKQANSSLCGMAALYNALIKRSSSSYLKIVKDLLRTGQCTIGSYVIAPHPQALEMYDVNPQKTQDFKGMGMFEVDWLVLATTRSKESTSNLIYKGKESGRMDMLKAVNWPDMLARMGKQVGGFSSSTAHGLSYNSINNKKRILSGRIHDYFSNSDLEELLVIDGLHKKGRHILMMIDADMIYNKSSYSSLADVFNDSHWVVYEGGLTFYDADKNPTSDLEKAASVSFKIFTWGRDPQTGKYLTLGGKWENDADVQKMIGKPGLNIKSFKSNYYGYIEMY
ncbi:hypothetical protein NZD88_11010 [Chryseobacterium antibioticum]|uniref:Uncharacterized protein n=1 Tax=Chryseobacterium pyrolae TaxID=2987481 RepID=A0ABT2IHJ3_9FLAO|nr:hypothetical protein [Chryseobacterium pyrolae]MCT2408069.1 hypothetical protein [Chryseobacterium pyrolae]